MAFTHFITDTSNLGANELQSVAQIAGLSMKDLAVVQHQTISIQADLLSKALPVLRAALRNRGGQALGAPLSEIQQLVVQIADTQTHESFLGDDTILSEKRLHMIRHAAFGEDSCERACV